MLRVQNENEEARRRAETDERDRRRAIENSMVNRVKRYGDAIKLVVNVMPDDIAEVPMYLDGLEKTFRSHDVPQDLWAKLLNPHLSQQAKSAINRLTDNERDQYDVVKEYLLKQFKLTAIEHKSKF